MDLAKLKFLFEAVPDDSDLDDPDVRTTLIAADVEAGHDEEQSVELITAVRTIVANQILEDNPPEVWTTVQRLYAAGLDRDVIWASLQYALARVLRDTMNDGAYDEEVFLQALEALPMPSSEIIVNAYVDFATKYQPIAAEELDEKVASYLGLDTDNEYVENLLDRLIDELFDENGPLEYLAGDRVVHPESLTAAITLTHRINDAELKLEVVNVAFDLAPFGVFEELRLDPTHGQTDDDAGLVEAFSADQGHLAWHGPDGWLDDYSPGDLIAIRVDAERLTFQRLTQEPPMTNELVALVRDVYDREVTEPELPVSGQDLILGMLAQDREVFSTPRPPLDELCEAAGLERCQDHVAHNAEIWANQRVLWRMHRVADQLEDTELTMAALKACKAFDDDGSPVADLREVLDSLYDPEVLEVVAAELLSEFDEEGNLALRVHNVVDRLCDLASKARQIAVARLLAARVAEADHEPLVAEAQLHLANEADPNWTPALDRLAWYLSDRGDAAAAARLWRHAGISPSESQDLAEVEKFTRVTADLGRNDPCWCGSGRKFKQCHAGQPPRVALPDRVGWLCRKAVTYLERNDTDAMGVVIEMMHIRAGDPEDQESLMDAAKDPLVIDVVLHELGWFERFLADREALLPDDEAMLTHSWTLVDRTVYEITEVRPGSGVTIRDIRTGDRIDVREHSFSRQARVGTFICTRAVPDGEQHQFIGGLFPVAPGRETYVLDILDNEEPEALLAYVASLYRMPQMMTRENEPMVICNAAIEIPDATAARRFLDNNYEPKEQSWIELFDLNEDEAIVRATITMEGGIINVDTTSENRIDRTVAAISAGVEGARLISDKRKPFDPERDGVALAKATSATTNSATLDPEVISQVQEMMERRWLDDNIPALGGFTPRQAADDPTRRDELRRLIDSFDEPFVTSGGFGMRPVELRRALGL